MTNLQSLLAIAVTCGWKVNLTNETATSEWYAFITKSNHQRFAILGRDPSPTIALAKAMHKARLALPLGPGSDWQWEPVDEPVFSGDLLSAIGLRPAAPAVEIKRRF